MDSSLHQAVERIYSYEASCWILAACSALSGCRAFDPRDNGPERPLKVMEDEVNFRWSKWMKPSHFEQAPEFVLKKEESEELSVQGEVLIFCWLIVTVTDPMRDDRWNRQMTLENEMLILIWRLYLGYGE